MSQQETVRAEGLGAEPGPVGAPMRQMRDRLVRQRASDARIVRLAQRIAVRRVEAAPKTPSVALWEEASAVTIAKPRLDAAVIGRHCRQAFPVALSDGVFGDLLATLEQAERHHGGRSPSSRATLGASVGGR